MTNEIRMKIGGYMIGVPLIGGIIIGSIHGLTNINWSSMDWKFGAGIALTLYLGLAGMFLWSGSKDKENGQETTNQE